MQKINYRPEIDGLRAIAVLAVIINHFNKDVLPSGYLGVDIFFVISGYVITSSLSIKKYSNFLEFITNFYEKRIKRILPALIFFLIITSILICLFNSDPHNSLKTAIYSIFGLSNIYLFRTATDYFATSTELNPFINTWSLGVEEQFYLIFPIILWVSGFGRKGSRGSRNLFICMLCIVLISLILFLYLYQNNQPAAYFLMPSRFWEMGMGCLLFISLQREIFIKSKIFKIPPLILMLGIWVSFFLPKSTAIISVPFIVFITVLLIARIREENITYKLLTNKYLMHVGLISYSLYLWHWGILSISRWTIGINIFTFPIQLLIIYLISIFSFKYIETPFRKNNWSLDSFGTIFKGIVILILSSITLILIKKPLSKVIYLGKNNLILEKPHFKAFEINEEICYFNQNYSYTYKKILSNCFYKNKENKKTLYLLGDSHAFQFWQGAELIAKQINTNLFTFTAGETPFPPINYTRVDNKDKLLRKYNVVNSLYNKLLSEFKEGDIVFIKIRYPYYFGKDWHEYPSRDFRFLNNYGKYEPRKSKEKFFEEWLVKLDEFSNFLLEKKVSVIISTPTPEFPLAKNKYCRGQNMQWFNFFSKKNCKFESKFFISPEGKYSNLIKKLKEISSKNENLYLFDSFGKLCNDSICNYYLNKNVLYIDDDHISNKTARKILAPEIIEFLIRKNLVNIE